MNRPRDLRGRSPSARSSAPWNHAQARATALAFLMFSQTSSWPISFMKPPISVSALRGTGSPVIGSCAEHGLAAGPSRACPAASSASGRRIASLMNRRMPVDEALAEVDQPVDRLGEDPLRAVPDAAEVEDVAPAQRVEEAVDRLP